MLLLPSYNHAYSMAERETPIDRSVLEQAIHLAAKDRHGLTLRLQPDEELRLVLAGSGEVMLFIGAKANGEARSPAPVPAAVEAPEGHGLEKRVKLRGRVGSDPQYKPLPRRGLRVGFRFAAFTGGEKPAWADIYATGTFALAIQAKGIGKGDEVELTGERQQAVQRQRDGSDRLVERIFAYGVSIKKRAQRPQ